MKKTYLLLTVLGVILPNIFVVRETLASGNILLWTDPMATFQAMFANNVSSAFAIDLIFVVVLFLFWSYKQAQQYQIKYWWTSWLMTFVLGLAGGLPFFLYLRTTAKNN